MGGGFKVRVISGLLREGASSAVCPLEELGQAPGGKGLVAPAFRARPRSDGGGSATGSGILPVGTLRTQLLQDTVKMLQREQKSLVLDLHLSLGERRSL